MLRALHFHLAKKKRALNIDSFVTKAVVCRPVKWARPIKPRKSKAFLKKIWHPGGPGLDSTSPGRHFGSDSGSFPIRTKAHIIKNSLEEFYIFYIWILLWLDSKNLMAFSWINHLLQEFSLVVYATYKLLLLVYYFLYDNSQGGWITEYRSD